MNTPNATDLSVTTFANVVVQKAELLKTLEVNRDKHNSIYEAAVAGYWIDAQKVLDQKKIEFDEAISKVTAGFAQHKERLDFDFTHQLTGMQYHVGEQNKDKVGASFALNTSFSYGLPFNTSWPLRFPENHLEDYSRVIDMLNFSVADKVSLSSADFDAYVRNNWSWRSSFLNTNATYANSLIAISGCCTVGNVATTGSICGIAVTGGSIFSVTNQLDRIF